MGRIAVGTVQFSSVQFIHFHRSVFWLQTPLDVEFVKTTILAI